MYGYHNNNDLSYPFSGDFLGDFTPPEVTFPVSLSSLPFPPNNSMAIPASEFDSVSLLMKQELCNYTTASTSSGCSSYSSPSSLTSCGTTQTSNLMQRSVSSHSLQKNVNGFQFHLPAEFLISDTSPVRKAFSTGDLERINMVHHNNNRSESPLSNESSIIEGMNAKACKYSPEEKKERIERYRSKRNQRNFNKKIKYICRKTLADSRPRIRGRFARNDENEKATQNEWNHVVGEHEDLDDDDENWINFLDAFSANLIP